ncbi:MAG: hypothetical protein M3R24_41545 [Chloroflexota bacterium]|nr:hypothetical protein [Chloroflexota bacterium]
MTHKPSAIISGARLAKGQPIFERVIGLALLVLSFAGTMALLNGGWHFPLNFGGLLAGAIVQGLLTSCQWLYQSRRRSLAYLAAVAVDAALSVGGFAPLFYDRLVRLLPFGLWNESAAWGMLALGGVVLAVVPEYILVDS